MKNDVSSSIHSGSKRYFKNNILEIRHVNVLILIKLWFLTIIIICQNLYYLIVQQEHLQSAKKLLESSRNVVY